MGLLNFFGNKKRVFYVSCDHCRTRGMHEDTVKKVDVCPTCYAPGIYCQELSVDNLDEILIDYLPDDSDISN